MTTTAAILTMGILIFNFARAENLPANKCEVFIKYVGVSPSSHGFASITAIVKANWIGNGETVRQIGFWGKVETEDLGNSPSCHWSSPHGSGWKLYSASTDFHNLNYGEVRFNFPVRSGSVVGQCPGFYWSWIGSFFVETDKNTYWVNPSMDASQNFYFDNNGANVLMTKGGYSNYMDLGLSTSRDDMKYYNPKSCQ